MSHIQQDFASRIRELGYRVTPQRQLILDAICETGGHATISEVYDRVTAKAPAINRATVYRTVNFLQELQLVVKAEIGGTVVYEIAAPTPHHHLVCRCCGHVQILADHHFAELSEHLLAEHGFTADINHLTIPGTCAGCREAADG